MGNFRKNLKRTNKATKSVDKAQNALMKQMKKQLDALESVIETKYSITNGSFLVDSYDGSSAAGRSKDIREIRMGEAQGMGDLNQRIGDQITLKHFDFNYRVELQPPLAGQMIPSQTSVRVVVFWDNQPSAVNAAGGTITNTVAYPQLFQSATSAAPTDAIKLEMILTEKDWDNRHRFSIVFDKTHTLCPNTDSTTSAGLAGLLGSRSCIGVQKLNKSYKKQKIRFVSGSDTVVNRKLYFCAFSDANSDGAVASPALPKIIYHIRALYEDA